MFQGLLIFQGMSSFGKYPGRPWDGFIFPGQIAKEK
jgi:hypothetical protein